MLYGIRNITRALWQYMTKKLEQSGLKQSNFNPCHFVGEKITCILYVNNLIFWDWNEDDIHNLAMHLRELGFDLEQEDDAAKFLEVDLEQERDTVLI